MRLHSVLLFVIALLVAASMWFYVERILVPYQVRDAAQHQRPRGNLSDLYPRWLGARELLLHHRNPYGEDVTKEIQKGYYGRELDSTRPNEPKDQQSFAYPVYVVFVLAPLIGVPFSALLKIFPWLLALLTAASVGLWLRVLHWRLAPIGAASAILLTMGSFPAVQGIKLQQLSLLVAAMLAGAAASAGGGFLLSSGILLALATIKPQIAWPLVIWLLLWSASDWQRRRRLALSFAGTMAVLLLASEIVLPGWWRMFASAIARYHQYTHNQSVIEVMIATAVNGYPGFVHVAATVISVAAVLICGMVFWKFRRSPANHEIFGDAAALALALTVLIVPMFAPYNQVLLLPAILLLLRRRSTFYSQSAIYKFAYCAGIFIICWQWGASLCLTVIALLSSQERAFAAWKWPFFATFVTPIWIFGLVLLSVRFRLRSAGRGGQQASSLP